MCKLVLWDIDGTLLQTSGVSKAAMHMAVRQVMGVIDPPAERTFYSGKTDWQIICDMLPDRSIDAIAEQLPSFSHAYVSALQQRIPEMIERSQIFPGVVDMLQRLYGAVVQAPLTGNVAPVARIKLSALQLAEYLDLDVGAYGNDHYNRWSLVPIAVERAGRRYRRAFTGSDVVIIGDTPNDIRTGKANGARTVAVATGPYSLNDLRPYEPDVLLPDLSACDAALEIILGD